MNYLHKRYIQASIKLYILWEEELFSTVRVSISSFSHRMYSLKLISRTYLIGFCEMNVWQFFAKQFYLLF